MRFMTQRARDPRILIRFHYVNAHVIHVLMFSTSSNAQFIERSWWPSGLVVGLPSYGPGAGMSLPLGDEDHSPLGIE